MPKLHDIQSILLQTAAQHDGGNLYPLSATINNGPQLVDAVSSLRLGLIAQRETAGLSETHQTDGNLRFGRYATEAGLRAIGITEDDDTATIATELASSPPTPRVAKAAMVVDLLKCQEGATLLNLIDATGWLQHITRSALTGLSKKGPRYPADEARWRHLLPHRGCGMTRAIDEQLARLDSMAPIDLRTMQRTPTSGPVPRISPKPLRLALACASYFTRVLRLTFLSP